jgi:hypothetical protein
MIRLSREQEMELLKMVNEDDFIDYGSSRAVYRLFYGGKEYAVKVFLDQGGYEQCVVERTIYSSSDMKDLVATIYAIGERCMVTEFIHSMDSAITELIYFNAEYDGYLDDMEHYYGEDYDALTEEQFDAAWNVITSLEQYNDETSDNCQLGYDENGNIKAYDYGYIRGENARLVGHMGRYVDLEKDELTVLDVAYSDVEYERDLEKINPMFDLKGESYLWN